MIKKVSVDFSVEIPFSSPAPKKEVLNKSVYFCHSLDSTKRIGPYLFEFTKNLY